MGDEPRANDHPGVAPRLSTAAWSLRVTIAVVSLAVLVWAWNKSEIAPTRLVQNAQSASDYLFGRSVSEEDRVELRDRAERTVLLDLADTNPELAADPVALRGSIPPSEWESRVTRAYERMLSQKRGGYFPPESDPGKIRVYVDALLETLAIAIWGTVFAVVLAIPASIFGARRSLEIIAPGVSPTKRATRWTLRLLARRSFDVCRGFNEFVLALILVAIIGLGPFAGVVALSIHTFGVLGKVFADAIESVRTGEIEGVTASGASPAQVVSYAVMPQIMPFVVSQSLLRFESNVRSASVLGIVGAGGIGLLIDDKIKSYQFQEVATMMILIIIVVSIIDFLCSRVMKRLV